MTNLGDETTHLLLDSVDHINIEELDTKLSNVGLSRGHGVECLDVTTLSEHVLHLANDGSGVLCFSVEMGVAVEVHSDDDLTFEVTDHQWVLALVDGQCLGRQWEDTSQWDQGSADFVRLLGLTNVGKGQSEETIADQLGSIDGSQRREGRSLERLMVVCNKHEDGRTGKAETIKSTERYCSGTPLTMKARAVFSSVLKMP